jgi:hypothetical protein
MRLPACRHADGTISSAPVEPSGVWSLRILLEEQSFLLIVRTRRIVTARRSSAGFSGFPAYSQILLRQLFPTLGPFIVVAPPGLRARSGRIGYQLSWSPMRSDYLIPSTRRVRRIVSEDSLHGISAFATTIERFSNLENLPAFSVG